MDRVIVGILFNTKIFRLSSIDGLVIDDLLAKMDDDKKLGPGYFSMVQNSGVNHDDYRVSLRSDDGANSLLIRPENFVLRKSQKTQGSSLNLDRVFEEFNVLWKCADRRVAFPNIRRVGLVAEYLLDVSDENVAALELIRKLTPFEADASTKFQLSFEKRDLLPNGKVPRSEIDEYWNVHTQIYNSELDETPVTNKIKLSIDVQKFYNPAKTNPANELRHLKLRLTQEKEIAKSKLSEIGLI